MICLGGLALTKRSANRNTCPCPTGQRSTQCAPISLAPLHSTSFPSAHVPVRLLNDIKLYCRVSVVRAAAGGSGGAQGDAGVFVTSTRRTHRRRKDPTDAIEALREAVSCLC